MKEKTANIWLILTQNTKKEGKHWGSPRLKLEESVIFMGTYHEIIT